MVSANYDFDILKSIPKLAHDGCCKHCTTLAILNVAQFLQTKDGTWIVHRKGVLATLQRNLDAAGRRGDPQFCQVCTEPRLQYSQGEWDAFLANIFGELDPSVKRFFLFAVIIVIEAIERINLA